jgi:hypothetical protein
VNASGAVIQLHGVSRSGTEYACVQRFGPFDGPSDAASIAAIASWKGVNVVRVPLNEDCWLGINGFPDGGYSAAQYQADIESYVADLHAHGLYAILDLHWTAPGTFAATGQEAMADEDHSPTFWSQVATAFKGDRATVFDLFNEPEGIDWACWLNGCTYTDPTTARGQWQIAGMQQLVTSVRATGATNVLMLGGLAWSNDLSGWLAGKPSDPDNQLAASFHVYENNACASASCWNAVVAPVAAQVPLVTGEIGESDATATFIDTYMAWADAHAISYLAWTWDTWGCGGIVLISDYTGTPCAGYGAGYQQHLATLP